jgi:hypothetical protein
MNKHLLGQAPEGWLTTPRLTLARGMYASCPSLILNSLQCHTLTDCLISNHVGRYCLRVDIARAEDVDPTTEPVSRPPALPDLPGMRCRTDLLSGEREPPKEAGWMREKSAQGPQKIWLW